MKDQNERTGPVVVRSPKLEATWPFGWVEGTVDSPGFGTTDETFEMTVTIVHGRVPDDVGDTIECQNTGNVFEGLTDDVVVMAVYDPELRVYCLIQKEQGCS